MKVSCKGTKLIFKTAMVIKKPKIIERNLPDISRREMDTTIQIKNKVES